MTTNTQSTSTRDVIATALVGLLLAIYAGYLVFDGMPLVRDARGMSAVALLLFANEKAAMIANFASLAVGIVALVSQNGIVLAAFVFTVVALWAAATYVRTGHGQRDVTSH
jgi:hypothetical protein